MIVKIPEDVGIVKSAKESFRREVTGGFMALNSAP